MQLRARAPGSLMMLGEYAVLYGKTALVTAVNKYITVNLTPRADSTINIHSALGTHKTHLSDLNILKPFEFVLAVLKHYQSQLQHGCDIYITSEFSEKVGLGSSAAVTVAMIAALNTWLGLKTSALDLVKTGIDVVHSVQGMGSGADIAASVYGGMVAYQNAPLAVEKFSLSYPLAIVYAGFKTPTVSVVKQVQDNFKLRPEVFEGLIQSIAQCAEQGITYVRTQDWMRVGAKMNEQQGIMESLGVSLPLLEAIVAALRKEPAIVGAKISGSGLGDCVIGLGEVSDTCFSQVDATGLTLIPATMTMQGVHCEKI